MEAEEPPSKVRRLSLGTTRFEGNESLTLQDTRLAPNVDSTDRHTNTISTPPPASKSAHCDRIGETDDDDAKATVSRSPDNRTDVSNPDPPLSKNQQKKLERKQDWEAGRDYRRAKRKTKSQERKRRKRADLETPTTSALANEPAIDLAKKSAEGSPTLSRRRHVKLPIAIIIDCSFDDLMLEKEVVSLSAQITRIYSDNFHAPFQAHLAVSSFGGQLEERFETVLSGQYKSWKGVRILKTDVSAAAEQAKSWMQGEDGGILAGPFAVGEETDQTPAEDETELGEVIYLTSDSPNTLVELKPYSTYVIGGLVDRNRHKGICYKKAMDRGLKTAKLPIGEYMQMSSRPVLATNHVMEILLRWLELRDWGKAFMQVMPKRKGGSLLEKPQGECPNGNVDTPSGDGEDLASLNK